MKLPSPLRALSFLPFAILASTCLFTGCGSKDEGPTVVADDVKAQQVRELQEQRASEWGGPKKK